MVQQMSPQEHREEARQFVRYEKDRERRIATITFDRQDRGNSTTIGMRMRSGCPCNRLPVLRRVINSSFGKNPFLARIA